MVDYEALVLEADDTIAATHHTVSRVRGRCCRQCTHALIRIRAAAQTSLRLWIARQHSVLGLCFAASDLPLSQAKRVALLLTSITVIMFSSIETSAGVACELVLVRRE